MVETEEQRKAKKEHESASHVAGLKATLDAGRLRDLVANMVPVVETIKDLATILEEQVPEAELEDLTEEALEEEPVEEDVQHAEEPEEITEEAKKEVDVEEFKGLIAKLKKLIPKEEE